MKKYSIFIALLCIVCSPIQVRASDETVLYIVLDTSGSMQNKYKWIAEAILSLKKELENKPHITDSIELRSFTDRTNILTKGNEKNIVRSINTIKLVGGIEDGFIPISKIANNVDSGAHILLITDEDRDRVLDVNSKELLELIIDKNITIHGILTRSFKCTSSNRKDGNEIIGINNYLEGITDKFTYVSCDSPQVFVNASSDYLDLIIGSNGHVWDLNKIIENSSDFGKYLAFELEEKYPSSLNAIITMFGSHFIENPVTFDASNTTSEDGIDPVTNWAWDFNSDGNFDDYGSVVTFYFDKAGTHKITLRLSNEQSPAVIINQTIKINISE